MLMKKNGSVWFLAGVYAAAFLAGVYAYQVAAAFLAGFWPMLVADVVATLVVWVAGLVAKNASTYDPYWSVAPAVMAGAWMLQTGHFGAVQVMLLSALVIWGVRLTANFLTGWQGLSHQDWRYGMLRDKNPKLWLVTNLFGINLFPTLIVFVCMVPAYFTVQSAAKVSGLSVLGLAMCLLAVYLQVMADEQMRTFKAEKKPGEHIEIGLWKLSRHPNYFGEVLFWWGVWTMQLGADMLHWATVLAPMAMTAMFLFISIPMMEEHMAEKCPGYSEYQKRVHVLVPLPQNNISQPE